LLGGEHAGQRVADERRVKCPSSSRRLALGLIIRLVPTGGPFEADGPIPMRGLCLCRARQQISGGGGNLFLGLMAKDFRYTKGEPRRFAATDDAPAREFCETCGLHLAARSPKAPDGVIVKVGAFGRRPGR
jgi:hypothetical protein